MRVIGITGGVGAGKSELLSYVEKNYNCQVILADQVAHLLQRKGEACYDALVELLGRDCLDGDGSIDKKKMAERIFADLALLQKVNEVVHPAVKEWILLQINKAKREGVLDFLFIEAALLIENGYENIADELWYIHADKEIRKERLRTSRAYSDQKIEQIMASQLSEDIFRSHCKVVIDNGGTLEAACNQIHEKLEDYLWQKK